MDILIRIPCTRDRLRSYVVGTMTESIFVPESHGEDIVAVRFMPGGAFSLLGIPASELTDMSLDLASLLSSQASLLEDRILPLDRTRDRIAVLETFLLGRLTRSHTIDRSFLALARQAWDRPQDLSVDALSRLSGVSSRQLERRFQKQVGIGPKLLLRVLRFQKVVQECSDSGSVSRDWAETALKHGYFDQAHLIRDFNDFAGTSPKRYFDERMSDFSNPADPSAG